MAKTGAIAKLEAIAKNRSSAKSLKEWADAGGDVPLSYKGREHVWAKKVKKFAEGGGVSRAAQIDGNDFVLAAQKHGLGQDIGTLNKMVALVNKGATVEQAARAVAQGGKERNLQAGGIAKLAKALKGTQKADDAAKTSLGEVGSMVSKMGEEERSPIIPMPNRWFLQPDKFPHQQKMVERVLERTGLRREDFPSGAFVDPRTGEVLDSRIMNELGVVIDPKTNRPMMSAKGESGIERIDPKTGSFTRSNLVRKGLFKPEGGDPLLNDLNFLATIEKGDVGHKYGLATEYASPAELWNTGTGANPTLRPRSRGDLFGVGDVVGRVRVGRSEPHDVYEKLFVAPKGSDVQGVKLSKAKGGEVHMKKGGEPLDPRFRTAGGDPLNEFVPPRYRSAGRRPESQNDREAAANIPVAVARGLVSGTLGLPGDIESIARLPYELITGKDSPTILPTSSDIEKRLPFRGASQTPAGQLFTGAGQLAGGAYTGPLSGARAMMAVPRAAVRAGRDFVQSAGQTVSPLTVYHGSPHKFDRFDASKIGTGEGAQAYGHGLYLAEAPGVAEDYRRALAGNKLTFADDAVRESATKLMPFGFEDPVAVMKGALGLNNDVASAIKTLRGGYDKDPNLKAHANHLADLLESGAVRPERAGHVYTVDLPDEKIARMLDWDKPLSQQPEVIKALKGTDYEVGMSQREAEKVADMRLRQEADEWAEMTGGDPVDYSNNVDWEKYVDQVRKESGSIDSSITGKDLHRMIMRDEGYRPELFDTENYQIGTSEALRGYGIPGIRYLDASSRDAGKGTSNFVVFPGEEDALTILERKKEGGEVKMADGGAAFGRYTTGKKYQGAVKRAKEADVNTLADPRTYAAVMGLLGSAPDQLGFSVMHPDYKGIQKAGGEVNLSGGGLSKIATEAMSKLKGVRKEFVDKVAEQARYQKETAHIPTKDLPSFEEWKAKQINVTPENIEQLRKETGNRAGGEVKMQAGGAIKTLKNLLGGGSKAEDAATAAQRAAAGRMAADVAKATEPMKMSEALGKLNVEGKGKVKVTQSDRTRVGGGNIGGAMFPGLSQVDPFYQDLVWGVGKKSTGSGLINQSDDLTYWSTLLGSEDQLKSNPIVFNKLRSGFVDAMKQGKLSKELEDKINKNLSVTFGEGADIRDPKIWQKADTFDRRTALADVMLGQGLPPSKGGVPLGGEKSGKGVIFKPTDVLKRETAASRARRGCADVRSGPEAFPVQRRHAGSPRLAPWLPRFA
jgi:hypothetical protein